MEAMCESLSGLVHLKETYAGDNTLISQLDVVIEDINEMMKNMKGYKKESAPTVVETPIEAIVEEVIESSPTGNGKSGKKGRR
jgi:hypothetical protein